MEIIASIINISSGYFFSKLFLYFSVEKVTMKRSIQEGGFKHQEWDFMRFLVMKISVVDLFGIPFFTLQK